MKIAQIVFLLLVFVAGIGWANDEFDLEDLMFQNIQEVYAASKKPQNVSEAPASVYIITKNDIRMRGYEHLKDVLRDVPGMETIENYFSEMGTLVPVRGIAGNNKIIVLLNGVRVNPPGGEEMMFRNDFSVKGAEHIEIVYGPGSTLYGQDAISAVINVITERPDKNAIVADIDTQSGVYTSLSQKIGENASLSAYLSYYNGTLSKFDNNKAWWNAYKTAVGAEGLSAAPVRVDRGINFFSRLETGDNSLQLWYRKSLRSSAEGGYIPILLYEDGADWDDSSFVLEAKNKTQLFYDVDLESSVVFNQYEILPDTRYVWTTTSTDNSKAIFWDDYKYGIGTVGSLEEKAGYNLSDSVSLVGGVQLAHYDVIPKCTIPGGKKDNSDLTSQGGDLDYYKVSGDAGSKVSVPRATDLLYDNIGIYLEGNWKITDSLLAVVGLRTDNDTRIETSPVSPRFAAIYKLSPDMTVKYVNAKAFVAPSPYYEYNVFDNGSAVNISNPDLKPEEAVSNELSFTWTTGNFSTAASAYYNQQWNLITVGDKLLAENVIDDEVYVLNATSGQYDKRMLVHSVNSGRSWSKGVDISGRYTLGPVALWGSYSYVDYEVKQGGSITGLPGLSHHNVRLGCTYSIDKLHITPSLVLRSSLVNVDRSVMGNDLLYDETIRPYELNAYFLYDVFDDLQLYADFTNITNNKYALKGMLGLIPQEPFQAAVGMKQTW